MTGLIRDLRHAVRGLLRRPILAVVAMAVLGLALGAATTLFSVVDGVVATPLPYRQPDRLVRIWDTHPERGLERAAVPPARFADWRRLEAFSGVVAVQATPSHLTGGPEPLAVEAHRVSVGYFSLLGLRLEAGRGFDAEEVAAGAPVAVVHRDLARRWFGDGADAALGRWLMVDGVMRRVVGIAGTDDPLGKADLWLPLSEVVWSSRAARYLAVFGRLGPGVTVERARAELAAAAAEAARRHPQTDAGWEARLATLRQELLAPVRPALAGLSAAVALVFLVACANVAALLLARGWGRRRELAVRTALGAGRPSLWRALIAESLVLAVAGGLLGAIVSAVVLRLVPRLAPAGLLPRLDLVAVNGRTFLFLAIVSLLAAGLAGLLPLREARRVAVAEVLRQDGDGVGLSRRRAGLFDRLVVAQVAVALLLLAAAALLSVGFVRLVRSDLGFDPRGVLAVEVAPARAGYRRAGERADLYRRLIERMEALPGVTAVGAVSRLPLSGEGAQFRFLIEGRPVPTTAEAPTAEMRAVGGAYAETLEIARVAGVGSLIGGDGNAVLVNRELASRHWPRDGAVGRRVSLDGPEGPWRPVIGVVDDVQHFGPAVPVRPEIWVPLERDPWPSATLVLRTGGEPAALAPAVRRALAEVDPDLPASRVVPLAELYAASVARPRFSLVLLATFALVAVVLTAAGLYGTQAYAVSLRRHEIGVRMSLGAERRTVLALVLRHGAALAMAGMVAGSVLAVLAAWALRGLVPGVDEAAVTGLLPWALLSVGTVLFVVLLGATFLPARTAAAIEPAEALRRS